MEPKLNMESITGAVESGQADQLLSRLEQVSKNPENIKEVTSIMIQIDSSKAMTKFREFWQGNPYNPEKKGLPKLAKWAFKKALSGAVPAGSSPLDMLVKCGFIHYDEHLDENGEVNDQKIQKMGGMNKYLLKYGVPIGAIFIPELKAVEPFVKPILKLQEIEGNILDKVRPALRQARKLREAPARDINHVAKQEHSKILSILPPANDNALPDSLPAANDNAVPTNLPPANDNALPDKEDNSERLAA